MGYIYISQKSCNLQLMDSLSLLFNVVLLCPSRVAIPLEADPDPVEWIRIFIFSEVGSAFSKYRSATLHKETQGVLNHTLFFVIYYS